MNSFLSGFILATVIAGGLYLYDKTNLPKAVLAKPAPELKNAKTETIKCVPLLVYRDVKKPLGIPEADVKDPSKQVVGSIQIAASEHQHTVTALANTSTGEVQMFVRQDPLAWLNLSRPNSVGASYGIREDGKAVVRLDGAYGLLSVKVLKLDAIGDIDSGSRAFVGLRVSF